MTRFGGCQPPPAFFTDIYFSQAAAASPCWVWAAQGTVLQVQLRECVVCGTLTKQLSKNSLIECREGSGYRPFFFVF